MKIAVLGGYQTKFGELWNKSLEDLIFEASIEAIKDGGLNKSEIEIAFLGNKLSSRAADQTHLGALMNEVLGIGIPAVRVEAACASGGVAMVQASLAIASGEYEVALVIGAEKMTDLSASETVAALMEAGSEEERQAGLSFVGLYALMAQKYINEYGASEKDLANVAVKNHFHASLNEKAQFPYEITLKQVLASPVVASPLKLLDCSPVTDGAAAVVLASEKFAKKRSKKNIWITASVQTGETLSLSGRKSLTGLLATERAVRKAKDQAGVKNKEIDFLEVHDCFTIAEILALEDLGFYPKGEGYLAVRNGEVKIGGKRPVNLSGGLKACGHPVGATGVKQIVEIYNQLRGRGGKRQVENAKLGLAHNVGGTGGTVTVHVLQK
jgi:acetyl-CoA C-acetyltransferase